MKNKYLPAALSIYVNYIIIGVSVIVLSLNMDFLLAQWDTDRAGFGFVVSGIGIGKFAVLFIAGALSDKWGRKPFIIAGAVAYIICFIGFLYSPNIYIAFALAILSGAANALIDAGSYAALMESYPKTPGTATLIVKIAVVIGQFSLPFFVSLVIATEMYYGWSFYILIAILAVNVICLLFEKFPPLSKGESSEKTASEQQAASGPQMVEKPKLYIEGAALILYGYTATAGLTLCQMWLQKIGQDVAGMSVTASNALMSYFSIGSLCAVFITAYLVKSKLRPTYITALYPILSIIMGFIWYMYPTPVICMIAAFVMGYSIAGGILQMAITALAMFYPGNGGKCTGAVNSLNSIAIWTVPLITGIMADKDMKSIILFLTATCIGSCILGFIAMMRDRKVFGIHKSA